jgi:hypothetical protein
LCNGKRMFKWLNWRNVISSFVGGILRTLFVAICIALGVGPDKWAAFLIAGMPFLLTPGVVRLAFLLLASLTLASLLWNKILNSESVLWKAVSIVVVCLPFVAGSFYVTANSVQISPRIKLTDDQRHKLDDGLISWPERENLTVAIFYLGANIQSQIYASDLAGIFALHNWRAIPSPNPALSPELVGLHPLSPPSVPERIYEPMGNILTNADIKFQRMVSPEGANAQYGFAVLIVGSPPFD